MQTTYKHSCLLYAKHWFFVILLLLSFSAEAQPNKQVLKESGDDLITLTIRDMEITEVMNMLSMNKKINIILSNNISGEVSINLYDVDTDHAIRSIAKSQGLIVEVKNGDYFILPGADAGKTSNASLELRTYKIQYSDIKVVEEILNNYLSERGKITTLPNRNMLVVQDTPEFVDQIEKILHKLDSRPRQILIEAKILEITLDDSDTFGLDWKRIFSSGYGGDGTGSGGTKGLSGAAASGFFLEYVSPNIEITLDALKTRGRVRTLSTPKLLTLEGEEASVIIGDRLGYKVTTTINQVTNESIQFLESGIILKVKSSIDAQNRVMIDIHPEISTGTISNGIPSQSTTEVTTQILVDNAQTIFIGGLLKNKLTEVHEGIPLLGDLPLLGGIFSKRTQANIKTETIVLITPYIIDSYEGDWNEKFINRTKAEASILKKKSERMEKKINRQGFSTSIHPESTEPVQGSQTENIHTVSEPDKQGANEADDWVGWPDEEYQDF